MASQEPKSRHKKDAYYFSHDSNARNDDKILELRAQYGWEGYGVYWAIIEILRDSSDYCYPSNAKAGLSLSLNIGKADLEKYLNKMFEVGLLEEKNGCFYSESLMKRMEEIDEKRRKRAAAGRLGGTAKAMLQQKSSNATANPSKESKVKEKKVKEFKPPTLDEFVLYFTESGYHKAQAEKAYRHYSIGNWHDAQGKKVKNWKQKVNNNWFTEQAKVQSSTKRFVE